MTETAETFDPRPQLSAALYQTRRQVEAFGVEDFGSPTPCAGYDVGTLVAHVIAVLRKLTATAQGEDPSAVPDPATDVDGNWHTEFGRAWAHFAEMWSAEAALDGSYTMPWAVMSGRDLLDAYTHEFTVHSWDLAYVTGRVSDLDPSLAEAALVWYRQNVPPDTRSDDGPFAPVVDVDSGADVYTRLAGYVGRQVAAHDGT